ncbi:glutamate racemase [Blattabacterium cuenoti]|uniref:glutamate racemase n=1 Tax=Blattabacterium cuenoti TaxID=1653831 RepID=UPI00163B8451|nr:glutamate racemase [Blattabacterium cuenoti]
MIKGRMNNPIGVFDSGVGGIHIAKEIMTYMPNECIVYFGDTKNIPYGNKSKDFIIDHSLKIASFLYKKKCKAIVIACNSIASNALDFIQEKFLKKLLIFNVIEPIVKNRTLIYSKKIGIMATPATIRSNFYRKKLKNFYPHLDVVQISVTPLLAKIIEYGFPDKKINSIIRNCLTPFQSIDTLLLGCTHYLFFKKQIDTFYHGKVHLIDIPRIVVREIKNKLEKKSLLSVNHKFNNKTIFYTSSSISPFFQKQIEFFFENAVIKKIFNFF